MGRCNQTGAPQKGEKRAQDLDFKRKTGAQAPTAQAGVLQDPFPGYPRAALLGELMDHGKFAKQKKKRKFRAPRGQRVVRACLVGFSPSFLGTLSGPMRVPRGLLGPLGLGLSFYSWNPWGVVRMAKGGSCARTDAARPRFSFEIGSMLHFCARAHLPRPRGPLS